MGYGLARRSILSTFSRYLFCLVGFCSQIQFWELAFTLRTLYGIVPMYLQGCLSQYESMGQLCSAHQQRAYSLAACCRHQNKQTNQDHTVKIPKQIILVIYGYCLIVNKNTHMFLTYYTDGRKTSLLVMQPLGIYHNLLQKLICNITRMGLS